VRLLQTHPALSRLRARRRGQPSYSFPIWRIGFLFPMSQFARTSILILAVALTFLFVSPLYRRSAVVACDPSEQPDLVIVQTPLLQQGNLSQRFPQGSRLLRLSQDGSPKNLTADFFAAADPRVSFDCLHVLFAGKKSAETSWQIWEMDIDGSHARQITHCPDDCLKPAYLPRGDIVFTAVNERPVAAASQLWVSKTDGSGATQITFGPGDFQVETVLSNGMILATASAPLLPSTGKPADRQLYTLRPDGSGLTAFRCDHDHPAIRTQAEELADGSVVFVKKPLEGGRPGGELAWIRRGALHNAPLTLSSVAALSPQPLAAGSLVVARATGTTVKAQSDFGLYAFDTAQSKFGKLIYAVPHVPTVAAVPLAAHEPPRWYWSTLNPKLQIGYFICMDSYMAEGAPHGRLDAALSKVRVLMLEGQRETNLGEAPVEKDGSFYIAVPPDKPVRFELIDAAGHVVRAQRSWIWARSGDEHGCVGCHEDRAIAPENRWPMALRRFDTPTRLGVSDAIQPAH